MHTYVDCCNLKRKLNWSLTYRSWDEEAGEEIEECIKCCRKDRCYLVVWRDGNSHHSVICEVEEGEECNKEKPKEFCCCPFKAHHSIHNEAVICCLNEHIWDFSNHLHCKETDF